MVDLIADDILKDGFLFPERYEMAKRPRKVAGTKKTAKGTSAKRGTSSKAEGKASSPFLKALKTKKKAYKKFKSAKKGAGAFQQPDVPDGTYVTRWSAKCGIDKNSEPYVSLNWVITKGKYKGEKGNRYFSLANDDAWEWLSSTLQQLLDEDASGLGDNPEEIKDWIDQVNDLHPLTKTNISKNDQGYVNAYINELLEDEEDDEEVEDEEEEDDSEEEEESEEDDEEEEEESDEEESEDDEEEEEDDEEEEEYEIAKGDEVSYKPPKSRKAYSCTVTRVNKSKQTCALESDEGKKFTDVSWEDVETA